jgi:hypothetical protein
MLLAEVNQWPEDVKMYFGETTHWQYTHGVPDPTTVSPDASSRRIRSIRI